MQRSDVLIVGGGPAGATCARALQRAGMDVAVLDQAHFPRDKVCAGWITPALLNTLEIDAEDYGREHILQPINEFSVSLIGGGTRNHPAQIRYPETVSYGIRRHEFDDYLLRRAGARLFTGQAVRTLRHEGNEWQINDQFRAPMLVGAGGHACPVARALGARPAGENAVVAREIEFLLPEDARETCKVRGERPELYFSRDLAGYGWCIRKGDYLNFGLGRDQRWNLAKHVEELLAFLQRERGVPQPPKHLNGHAYLLYGHGRRNVVAHGALLIGDAAGLAYPQSGEGILPAVESGLLAAQTILEARGEYTSRRLLPYLHALHKRFGQRCVLNTAIPPWARVLLARALFRLPGLVRQVVLDRGFLHANQPALLPARPG